SAGFSPCWRLFRPDGIALGIQACGQSERTLPVSGTYTLKVADFLQDAPGTYNVTLEIVSGTSSNCAEALACGGILTRDIKVRGAADTFAFTAQAGEVASITTGAAPGSAPAFSPCWRVFGPNGTALGIQVCGQAERTLPATGTYTVY